MSRRSCDEWESWMDDEPERDDEGNLLPGRYESRHYVDPSTFEEDERFRRRLFLMLGTSTLVAIALGAITWKNKDKIMQTLRGENVEKEKE